MFSGQRWEDTIVLKYLPYGEHDKKGEEETFETGLISSVAHLCVPAGCRVHNTAQLLSLKRLLSAADEKKKKELYIKLKRAPVKWRQVRH